MQEIELKQIVPSNVCLRCEICCRFCEKDSVFSPHLTRGDIEALFKAGLPKPAVDKNRFKLINHRLFYCCPCFVGGKNECRFYAQRPFECRLYPFLLAEREKKLYLALDKRCPVVNECFVEENRQYLDYLKQFLLSPEIKELIHKTEDFTGDYSQDKEVFYIEQLSLDL